MATNPDVYLLYEYMKKNAFTVRVKVNLSETVDEGLLKEAAAEAMTRFPYYSVRVGLDDEGNGQLFYEGGRLAYFREDCG